MNDVITIGEAMITFSPNTTGPMKFVNVFEKRVGGAELNLAIGCSRLGLKVGYISRLGNDEFGKHIHTFAKGEGIDMSQVKLIDGYPTSLNFRELMADGNGRTFYYRDKSPTLALNPNDLDEEYIKKAKILHITGIYPAISTNNMRVIHRAIEIAKQNGLMISFDPNIRLRMWSKEEAREVLSEILPHTDILLAGDEEMDIIIGEKDPKAIIESVKEMGVSFVAVKQGENGSVGYYNGEIIDAPPVKATKVIDTVGAGDGFNAGILYGILKQWPLEKTLTFANTIGSMVVSMFGDNEGLPYYEDIQREIGELERIER